VLFETITVLLDPEPHGAALNMAIDEVLLHGATAPLLRLYSWSRPALSLGYFEKIADIEPTAAGRELVRRWTGGGVVLHGEDVTYTLIVPTACPFAQIPARESYRRIHEQVAFALRSAGVETQLAAQTAAKVSSGCFENPAEADLLAGSRKIAGAAQRRTRAGLLHQGSVLGPFSRGALAASLRLAFAPTADERPLTSAELSAATQLASERYATEAWLRRF
jgi:lipoate-protein ligase A